MSITGLRSSLGKTFGVVSQVAGKKAPQVLTPEQGLSVMVKMHKANNDLMFRILNSKSSSRKNLVSKFINETGLGKIWQRMKHYFQTPITVSSFFDKNGVRINKRYSQGSKVLKDIAFGPDGKQIWSLKYEPQRTIWKVVDSKSGVPKFKFTINK